MRTAKSLVMLLVVAASNAALIYGCSSSDNGSGGTGDDTPEAGNTDKDVKDKDQGTIIVEGGDDDAGKKSDAKGDAKTDAKSEASSDAKTDKQVTDTGPDTADLTDPAGSPCAPANKVVTRQCGTCGTQDRICLPFADGAPQSTWSDWGNCDLPADAECDPQATYTDEACGNCGTRQRVCQLDCKFAATACGNEGPCAIGTTDWQQGLGCPSSDGSVLGRAKTCNSMCQYDISTACTPQPADFNSIVITNNTVGATFTKEFTFVAGKTLPRITTSSFSQQACPTTVGTGTPSLYQYVTIKNSTAAAVKLSIYQSAGVTAPIADADTVMAVYAGTVPPSTPAQRNACIGFTDDACDETIGATLSPAGCVDNAAGLVKGELVGSTPYAGTSLAAGASLQVYVSEYSSSSMPGHFKISARIEN